MARYCPTEQAALCLLYVGLRHLGYNELLSLYWSRVFGRAFSLRRTVGQYEGEKSTRRQQP